MSLLLLCGCSTEQADKSKSKELIAQKEIVRRNELTQLDMKSLKDKLNKADDFIVMVTQSTCGYCNTMKRSVVPYLRENPDIPFFELEIDMLGSKKSDIDDNFHELGILIKEFSGNTPELLYIKDGSVVKQTSGDLDEAGFHNFLVDCGLVKEEKKAVEVITTTLRESRYLKLVDMEECAEKIENKDSFYLFIAENDRYNAALSETLAAYAEKNKVMMYVLNLTAMKQPETEEELEKLNTAMKKVETAITGYQYSPSILHIKAGKLGDILVDNVTEAELIEWFEKQQDGE